jgi:outer membrane protein TolC
MLRLTEQEESGVWRLKLEGKLAKPWTDEAERIWSDAPAGKRREIDLRGLTCADQTGRDLLHRMHREGASFLAEGVVMKALVEEVRSERFDSAGVIVKLVAILALVALAPVTAARAQTPPARSAPLRLTLNQAVAMGLKQSPEVALANLNLAEAQEGRSAAGGALLPQISLTANTKVTRASLEAVFGKKIDGFPDHTGPFLAVQAGAGGTAPIFDLALWHQWRAARESVSARNAEQATARELNAQLVVSQYLGSLRAAAQVDAVKTRLDLAKALFDLASDMQKNGVGTSIDTLRANVEYQNERQRQTEAEAQLSLSLPLSLQGLRRLLSLDPDQPIEIADAARFFETPAIDVDGSLERAYDQRPEMRTVRAEARAAELLKKSAQSERLPTLELRGGWSYEGLRPSTAIPSYQFGAYASVPLFTGGRLGAEIATRAIGLQKLTEVQRQVRDQIGFEVRAAATRLNSARTEVEAANLGVSLAREGVTQAQDRFRAGVANNIELITAQDELSRANDNQISALYRYNQARADVARATGQMETLYTGE